MNVDETNELCCINTIFYINFTQLDVELSNNNYNMVI